MTNKIIFNYMLDLKKEEIDQFERATIIRKYLEDTGISIRKLALMIDVPRSTVEDWLLWERMPEDKYKALKESGYTHLEIYKSLRNNKHKKELPIERKSKFQASITLTMKILRSKEKKVAHDSQDYELILKLRDQINRVLMYSEKNK